MAWQRQGECNWCGECCGAGGTDPRSFFPSGWPSTMRHKTFADFSAYWKYAPLVGVTEGPDGLIQWVDHGQRLVPGKGRFYYKWQPGVGLCKDISAAHDGSEWIVECPFLLPDDGTGGGIPHRPCPFVGSQFHDEWFEICGDEPPLVSTTEAKEEWEWRYPSCSYTWIEVP